MAEKLHLEIITPKSVIVSEDVDTFVAPGKDGEFQVMPLHTPFLTALTIGPLSYTVEGKQKFVSIQGGFCEVKPEKSVILAHSAEYAANIDVARAQEAKQRAEERLESNDPDIDEERAHAALSRAMNRITVSSLN